MNWAEHLISFYRNLQPPEHLPNRIQWLHPQKDSGAFEIAGKFFHKFYSDVRPRRLMLGINPGRFGAGVTGVNFTAPRQLTEACGIEHPFGKSSELSAEFIYKLIDAYGGPEKFYSDFFIGSVCPLGFIKDGKNLNYYDDRELLHAIEPFIVENISKLISFSAVNPSVKYRSMISDLNSQSEISKSGIEPEIIQKPPMVKSDCICIGGEKNHKYLSAINKKYNWFTDIVPLPHPRFIMQYRRKQINQFIDQYLQFMTN